MRSILLLALLAAAVPAGAATRQWTVSSFQRVRVSGPYDVHIASGAPLARAIGSQAALEAVAIEVQAGTLIVRPARPTTGGSGDSGSARIELATPALRGATLAGAGALVVAPLKAEAFALTVTGAGNATLEALTADTAGIVAAGSGSIAAAGRAGALRIELQGAGTVDAASIAADDVAATLNGSGRISATAARTARVVALGAGEVAIAGAARCTVRAAGSARVACGSDQHQR